jgi:hypothetical protein
MAERSAEKMSFRGSRLHETLPGDRVPVTLQSVLVASNRGNVVNKPPPERVASKTFFQRLSSRKSSSRTNAECASSLHFEVPCDPPHKVTRSMSMSDNKPKPKNKLPNKPKVAKMVRFCLLIGRKLKYPLCLLLTNRSLQYNHSRPCRLNHI